MGRATHVVLHELHVSSLGTSMVGSNRTIQDNHSWTFELDENGIIQSVSMESTATTGVPVHKVIGQSYLDHFPITISPEKYAELQQALSNGTEVTQFVFHRHLPDGRKLHVVTSLKPIHDGDRFAGHHSHTTDITNVVGQIIMEGLEALFDESPLGVAIMEYNSNEENPLRTWERIYVNNAFVRIFNYRDRQEALRSPPTPTWNDPAAESRILRAMTGKENIANMEGLRVRPDGTEFWVSMSVQHMTVLGKELAIGWHRDITDDMLRKARETSLAKLANMGEMAQKVAHEINQPLAIISFALTNIRNRMADLSTDDTKTLEYILKRLDRIEGQVHRATDIVQYMRKFAQQNEVYEALDLNAVITATIDFVREQCRLEGIDVAFDEPRTNVTAWANQSRIESILLNLIQNARDAINLSEGTRESNRIDISLTTLGDGSIEILVQDSGPGIDPEIADTLFDPFVTTKDAATGTGLGLAICRDMARDMGGDITARTNSTGAVFAVTLPPIPDSAGKKALSRLY